MNVTNIEYVNQSVPSGVTVVQRQNFVSARPVEHVKVPSQSLAAARVTAAAPVQAPERASFAVPRPGAKPPAAAIDREVVAAKAPPTRERRTSAAKGDIGPDAASRDERPRVRVVNPQREGVQGAPPALPPQAQDGKVGADRGRPDSRATQKTEPRRQAPRDVGAKVKKGNEKKGEPRDGGK